MQSAFPPALGAELGAAICPPPPDEAHTASPWSLITAVHGTVPLHVLLVKAIRPSSSSIQTRGCAKTTPSKQRPSAPQGHRTTVAGTWAVTLGVRWWLVGGPAMLLYEQGFTPHASTHSTPRPPEVCESEACVVAAVEGEERLEAGNPQAPPGDSGTSRGPGSWPTWSVWPGNCSQLPGDPDGD